MIADTILAMGALALTFYGIYATNRHNRLSVTPHLVSGTGMHQHDNATHFTYDLSNHGIGPAKLVSFTFFADGKEFDPPAGVHPLESLVQSKLGGKMKFTIKASSFPSPGYSILAGQTYRVLDLALLPNFDKELFLKLFKEVDLRVVYESFYGVREVFDSRGSKFQSL